MWQLSQGIKKMDCFINKKQNKLEAMLFIQIYKYHIT